MFKFRKLIITALVVLTVSAVTVGAMAAASKTPAEIVAGLTNKSVETVTKEKVDSGKTYGTIANDAGKLAEFKAQMIESRTAKLQELVKAGKITQARADEIIAAIKSNQASCDGTGTARIGQKSGLGLGVGIGNGQGRGQGSTGRGMGGYGMGQGVRDGSRANAPATK